MSAPCNQCGHLNQADARFCSQCAAPLSNVPAGAPAEVPAKEAVAAAPKNKNKAALLIAPIILISQVVLFAFVFTGDGCQGSVEGQMRSTGKPHGDFTMKPEACFSGEHESFFGVWVAPKLVKKDGRQGFIGGLKILKSEVGKWKVFVESPNDCKGLECEIRPLPEEHCPTFDVRVRNTSTTINDIRVREGHAKLDCTLPEGGTFQADLKFDGCS